MQSPLDSSPWPASPMIPSLESIWAPPIRWWHSAVRKGPGFWATTNLCPVWSGWERMGRLANRLEQMLFCFLKAPFTHPNVCSDAPFPKWKLKRVALGSPLLPATRGWRQFKARMASWSLPRKLRPKSWVFFGSVPRLILGCRWGGRWSPSPRGLMMPSVSRCETRDAWRAWTSCGWSTNLPRRRWRMDWVRMPGRCWCSIWAAAPSTLRFCNLLVPRKSGSSGCWPPKETRNLAGMISTPL